MTSIRCPLSVRTASLLLPLAAILGVAACSDSGNPGTGGGGDAGSNAISAGTGAGGGAPSAGSPGLGSGGTSAGSPGAGGGLGAGTAGLGSGGTQASAGAPGSGGTQASSGAPGTGGTQASSGAPGSGGTSAGGGGQPASAGTAGLGSGGTDAGSGGVAGGTGGGSSGSVFHIFMLMGQSNMAGVAKAQPSDKNTDERIKVLGGCNQPAGQWNLANPPLSDCPGEKGWNASDSVDPGIWFAKTLVEKLPPGDTIGLVATAESGESINTFVSGGSHHQMILNKIAKAKTAPNARFAGVIFHQGESDNGADWWPDKVVQLYNEVKAAWGVDYDVPFILGELPQGGCCPGHNTRVHQAADKLPKGYWVSQEGTRVMDEYHFDHDSVVLMGKRYGEKMIEALGW